MRVCTIDIGTNSVRALVADVRKPGEIRVVHREGHITRLGEKLGPAERGTLLSAAAIERTAEAVANIAVRARNLRADRFKVVATSAARNAANSDELNERIRVLTSLETEIISGVQEAMYVCKGAMSSLDLRGEKVLVADIGGGSTELIFVRRGEEPVLSSVSAGAVYITERFIGHDPPLRDELFSALQHASVLFRKASAGLPAGAEELVGLGGTITTIPPVLVQMRKYDASRVHGCVVTLKQVESVLRRLSSMRLAERKSVVGLEPGREDIIIGGLIILKALLRETRFENVRVSDRGILFGLALCMLRAKRT